METNQLFPAAGVVVSKSPICTNDVMSASMTSATAAEEEETGGGRKRSAGYSKRSESTNVIRARAGSIPRKWESGLVGNQSLIHTGLVMGVG